MKTTLALFLLLSLTSDGRILGTSYATMNCSQFACSYTGHRPATAAQLFAEGVEGAPRVGDIVAYGGVHVAVLTTGGLMDSTPERGVGRVRQTAPDDRWYASPVHVVRMSK